jgi:hypothetical protein
MNLQKAKTDVGTEEDQICWRAALKLSEKWSSPNTHLATARRCLGVYYTIRTWADFYFGKDSDEYNRISQVLWRAVMLDNSSVKINLGSSALSGQFG